MIVTLGSVRGAPGVSVSAMLLAAAWPGDTPRVVLEADVDGGVIGARYGLGVDPGASALVAAARHQLGDPEQLIGEAARRVGDRAWVVPGPESAVAALRLWSADRAATQVAAALAADIERVWIVDAGRVSSRAPVAALVARSDLALVFTRHEPADLVQVPERVADLANLARRVGVVVVGTPDYGLDELREFCGVRHVWQVSAEPNAVALTQRGWADRRLRRAPVWRDLVTVAAELAELIGPVGPAAPAADLGGSLHLEVGDA